MNSVCLQSVVGGRSDCHSLNVNHICLFSLRTRNNAVNVPVDLLQAFHTHTCEKGVVLLFSENA